MLRSVLGYLATSLVVIGALNWGLVGLFNFNLVRSILGPSRMIERTIYSLVGLAGLLLSTLVVQNLSQTSETDRILREGEHMLHEGQRRLRR